VSACGGVLGQAAYEDVEQQLEALVRVDVGGAGTG